MPTSTIYYPSTGLYSNESQSTASLVHCSVETSLQGLEAVIQLGMLFQNNHLHDMEDTIFHCKLDCDNSAMTSFSCRVEKMQTTDPEARFERRMLKRAVKTGSVFQCTVGHIPSGGDVVVFISWITNVAPVGNTVTLKVPLPAESKESSYSLPEETRIEHNAASIDYRKNPDNIELTFNTEAYMLSEIDMWDEEYDSDDDASDCSYGTQLEDDGPPTPVFEFEHYDEDEGFEGGYVDEHPSMPKTPWNTPGFGSAETLLPEMSSFVKDDELASYHFHYLAPPPARRQHPFKEPKFEYEDATATAITSPTTRARVIDIPAKTTVKLDLDHVWPEHGWC